MKSCIPYTSVVNKKNKQWKINQTRQPQNDDKQMKRMKNKKHETKKHTRIIFTLYNII